MGAQLSIMEIQPNDLCHHNCNLGVHTMGNVVKKNWADCIILWVIARFSPLQVAVAIAIVSGIFAFGIVVVLNHFFGMSS